MLVVDSSAYLAIAFPDEASVERAAMEQAIAHGGAIVPAIWLLEIENALRSAERSGRITPENSAEMLTDVGRANIKVEPVDSTIRFGAELALARSHDLSVYDAAYLELALRYGVPLMTVDRKLQAAAEAHGLAWTKGYSPLVGPKRRRRKKIAI